VTDEASAIEASGLSPALVAVNLRNFKVTTMDDLQAMRESLARSGDSARPLSASPSSSGQSDAAAGAAQFRIGQGWDVHALVPGRSLLIGGVSIPFDRGLLGHSDADVLLHAITDALLGAAALGDIGRHFPDTDARFAGADSRILLREALARVRAAGWTPGNVDCTVVAQAPKLAAHIPAMVAAIAADLGITPSQVNVKAKTAEKLGFAGRGEGIEAHATVLLVAAA
jgi:2-C-methyl-D-erythritol 2,4-cyclodiphosphate synthase